MAQLRNTTISDTGFLRLPLGTAAQKPSAADNGNLRYNSNGNRIDNSNSQGWTGSPNATVTGTVNTFDLNDYRIHVFTGSGSFNVTRAGAIDVLLVAGGGGAANHNAGGAGAGGVVFLTNRYVSTGNKAVTIGAGGAGGLGQADPLAANGQNTTFDGLTALGGGRGSSWISNNGLAGGSGAGGNAHSSGSITTQNQAFVVGKAATQPTSASSGFGNRGGDAFLGGNRAGGGGGGAGSPGRVGRPGIGGQGGDGLYFGNIFGRTVGDNGFFAGGGSGVSRQAEDVNVGGAGGGGTSFGQFVSSNGEQNAKPNTGGGGGAIETNSGTTPPFGGNGGSGVVIIRYPLP